MVAGAVLLGMLRLIQRIKFVKHLKGKSQNEQAEDQCQKPLMPSLVERDTHLQVAASQKERV